jgi:hypothetical protein
MKAKAVELRSRSQADNQPRDKDGLLRIERQNGLIRVEETRNTILGVDQIKMGLWVLIHCQKQNSWQFLRLM